MMLPLPEAHKDILRALLGWAANTSSRLGDHGRLHLTVGTPLSDVSSPK